MKGKDLILNSDPATDKLKNNILKIQSQIRDVEEAIKSKEAQLSNLRRFETELLEMTPEEYQAKFINKVK